MTIAEHVASGRARLAARGIEADRAAVDAEVLARRLLGWDRAAYLAGRRDPAPPWFGDRYGAWLDRRSRREPVSQIVGVREFWGREFEVTREVLTPRPETELIVEESLDRLSAMRGAGRSPRVLVDVGTGSGCLAVSLALDAPGILAIGTDTSEAALAVARRNVAKHDASGCVALLCASMLEAVTGPVDLIVSNPPYVPVGVLPALSPEVRDYEPASALAGGVDGLDAIRALVDRVPHVLVPGGWLVFEFGAGQHADVLEILAGCRALGDVQVREDLQGIPRTAAACRVG